MLYALSILLLSYCADIDVYTEEGLARSQNVQQCVNVLLSKEGVTVDCRDGQGLTPLHWALQLPSEYFI